MSDITELTERRALFATLGQLITMVAAIPYAERDPILTITTAGRGRFVLKAAARDDGRPLRVVGI